MRYKSTIYLLVFTTLCFSQSDKKSKPDKYFDAPSVIKKWKLDPESNASNKETFKVEPHHDNYAVFTSMLNGTNEQPTSENPANSVPESINFNDAELKFQISLKTLMFNNVFCSKLDIWAAYTQSSRWQVFNVDISRPFRETNYQPELILNHPININFLGVNWSYLGLALNHQSNGRSLPFSRSWNRIILEAGIQGDNYTIQLRPWFRLAEDSSDDDNPEISNFVGRGEALFTYCYKRFKFQTNLRHSLRFGSNSRGSFNVNVDYRLQNALSLNAQIFHGYGENLLDYNYKQTMLSFGVSFL